MWIRLPQLTPYFPLAGASLFSRLPRHEDKIAAYSCAQELQKQPWEDVPFRPGHRRRRRCRRRSNTGAEKSAADRLGIDLIPQRSDCESAKGLVPRPEGVPDLAHDDEVDACRVALEMLNPDMKGYGIYEFYRQKAEELLAEQQRDKPQPAQPTWAIGSMEWLAEQNKSS